MEWLSLPLKRYADFAGRSRRKEYWLFILGVGMLVVLAIFIPILALQVRRFHDQDKSGWFVLFQFIPYAGGTIMLVFMCIEGTRGPNRFGSDPVPENPSDTFA